MEEKKLVPKRRFKGFEGEWESEELDDLSYIITGGTPSTKEVKYWTPKEVPWMSSGEINYIRIKNTDQKISLEGLQNSSAQWIKPNSILIALAGQGKTRGKVAINEIALTTNQSIAAISPNKRVYHEFLFQNLRKRYLELRQMSTGSGARGGLNKYIISKIKIRMPLRDEQQKIGEFFKLLDQRIENQEKKIAKVKALKSAYLTEMFPQEGETVPRRRFEGFEDEWKRSLFSDILLTHSFNEYLAQPLLNGRYQVIQQGDVPIVGYSDKKPFYNFENVVLFGDHTLSLYKPEYPFLIATDGLRILEIRNVSGNFLYVLLTKYMPKSEGYKRHYSILQNIHCLMPPTQKEQQKIGTFFKNLDSQIETEERKLEKLKQMKKAYLEEMFV